MYAESQKFGKPNELKVLKAKNHQRVYTGYARSAKVTYAKGGGENISFSKYYNI